MVEKARKQHVAQTARTRPGQEQTGRTQDHAAGNDPSRAATPDEPDSPPGQLAVDDRGNMSWEWADDPDLQADDILGRTARLHALAPGHLSIKDETGEFATVKKEPIPVRKKSGYNPYNSGEPGKRSWKKKRDLREFSKWISLKKRLKDEPGGKP